MSFYATQEAESIQNSYKNKIQYNKTWVPQKVVMVLEADMN